MFHRLLIAFANLFRSTEQDALADIKHKDWASPHTLLLVAMVAYVLWISHMILTQAGLDLVARVFVVWLPCHAAMHCTTQICQAWGPNQRQPIPPVAPSAPAPVR